MHSKLAKNSSPHSASLLPVLFLTMDNITHDDSGHSRCLQQFLYGASHHLWLQVPAVVICYKMQTAYPKFFQYWYWCVLVIVRFFYGSDLFLYTNQHQLVISGTSSLLFFEKLLHSGTKQWESLFVLDKTRIYVYIYVAFSVFSLKLSIWDTFFFSTQSCIWNANSHKLGRF